jgi:hypothetical protein
MTPLLWILSGLAVLVILLLSVYAALLWRRVFQLQRKRQDEINARNARLLESIRDISMAMQQQQCPLSEGCIRLTVLLDHLVLPDHPDFPRLYPAIHDMHERIKHMPTHDARKAYPPQTIERMDEEREGHEVEMQSDIQSDVGRLLDWVREQRT